LEGLAGFESALNDVKEGPRKRIRPKSDFQLKQERIYQEECERGYKEGHEQGRAEGYRVGREEGAVVGKEQGLQEGREQGLEEAKREYLEQKVQEIAAFRESVNGFLQEAEAEIGRWKVESEKSLCGLALEIARRALAQELKTNPEAVLTIAREALEEVAQDSAVRIRVNPEAFTALDDEKELLVQEFPKVESVEVLKDATIQGGCVIETAGGAIDARVEDFLSRISRNLGAAA
jgi:flagellar assembly protein FliH